MQEFCLFVPSEVSKALLIVSMFSLLLVLVLKRFSLLKPLSHWAFEWGKLRMSRANFAKSGKLFLSLLKISDQNLSTDTLLSKLIEVLKLEESSIDHLCFALVIYH